MEEILEKQGKTIDELSSALNVELLPNGNGSSGMIATKNLDIAKLVTNEQRIEEEKFLEQKEEQIQNRYRGIRRYLRLFEIVRVISTLSLYLYLDQLDIHQPTLSQQLGVLRTEGVVATRRQGKNIFYSVADPAVLEILTVLYRLYCPKE